MPNVGVYVPVSAIFPEVSSDFATFCRLVRSLSRTDTLYDGKISSTENVP